jgi:rubrerythrin
MNSLEALQRVFQRESATMAQYLVQISPWAGPEDAPAKALIERIAAEERQWCERLAELIDRRNGVPLPGSYPSTYSSFHYIALSALLPRLCDYLRASIELLKGDLNATSDDQEARSLLEQIVRDKELQLREVEQLLPQLRKAS